MPPLLHWTDVAWLCFQELGWYNKFVFFTGWCVNLFSDNTWWLSIAVISQETSTIWILHNNRIWIQTKNDVIMDPGRIWLVKYKSRNWHPAMKWDNITIITSKMKNIYSFYAVLSCTTNKVFFTTYLTKGGHYDPLRKCVIKHPTFIKMVPRDSYIPPLSNHTK